MNSNFVNLKNLEEKLHDFSVGIPFHHCVIDDFFNIGIAESLEREFLDFNSDLWHVYNNPLEIKKACNIWNFFPPLTYQIFTYLNSSHFVTILSSNLNESFYPDPGLHGGGWHIHGNGGILNPHLDYDIHPKANKRRKLNLIVYLSEGMESFNGGHLGLWNHDPAKNTPASLIKEVAPKFNRAVLFDTSQNSWHGLSRPLSLPDKLYRKSIAVYYLIECQNLDVRRERALFAPRDDQIGQAEILELILRRSDNNRFSEAYRVNKESE